MTSTTTPTAEELRCPPSLLNYMGASLRAVAVTAGMSGSKIPHLCPLLTPVSRPAVVVSTLRLPNYEASGEMWSTVLSGGSRIQANRGC